MSAKHTRGPWKVIETRHLPHDGDHVADMSNGLMVVPSMFGLGDPLADARLIAAAPDLLGALEAVKAWDVSNLALDIPLEIRKQMQAAIAKATGATP